jgi:hypothetical protein
MEKSILGARLHIMIKEVTSFDKMVLVALWPKGGATL